MFVLLTFLGTMHINYCTITRYIMQIKFLSIILDQFGHECLSHLCVLASVNHTNDLSPTPIYTRFIFDHQWEVRLGTTHIC